MIAGPSPRGPSNCCAAKSVARATRRRATPRYGAASPVSRRTTARARSGNALAQSALRARASLRPGFAARCWRLSQRAGGARHRGVDEPQGRMLGQRADEIGQRHYRLGGLGVGLGLRAVHARHLHPAGRHAQPRPFSFKFLNAAVQRRVDTFVSHWPIRGFGSAQPPAVARWPRNSPCTDQRRDCCLACTKRRWAYPQPWP